MVCVVCVCVRACMRVGINVTVSYYILVNDNSWFCNWYNTCNVATTLTVIAEKGLFGLYA